MPFWKAHEISWLKVSKCQSIQSPTEKRLKKKKQLKALQVSVGHKISLLIPPTPLHFPSFHTLHFHPICHLYICTLTDKSCLMPNFTVMVTVHISVSLWLSHYTITYQLPDFGWAALLLHREAFFCLHGIILSPLCGLNLYRAAVASVLLTF